MSGWLVSGRSFTVLQECPLLAAQVCKHEFPQAALACCISASPHATRWLIVLIIALWTHLDSMSDEGQVLLATCTLGTFLHMLCDLFGGEQQEQAYLLAGLTPSVWGCATDVS